jgi:hypothetical protein
MCGKLFSTLATMLNFNSFCPILNLVKPTKKATQSGRLVLIKYIWVDYYFKTIMLLISIVLKHIPYSELQIYYLNY